MSVIIAIYIKKLNHNEDRHRYQTTFESHEDEQHTFFCYCTVVMRSCQGHCLSKQTGIAGNSLSCEGHPLEFTFSWTKDEHLKNFLLFFLFFFFSLTIFNFKSTHPKYISINKHLLSFLIFSLSKNIHEPKHNNDNNDNNIDIALIKAELLCQKFFFHNWCLFDTPKKI